MARTRATTNVAARHRGNRGARRAAGRTIAAARSRWTAGPATIDPHLQEYLSTHTDTRRPARTRWLGLLVFLVLTFAAGFAGNLLQGDDVGARYLSFERPDWAPPRDAFGIVWPVLYLLIGVAAWRVWDAAGSLGRGRGALALWALQLVVNAIWPGIFFGLTEFGWAIWVIVALDVVVVATLVAFARWDRIAAWLLTPYLGWILYATALNVAIWQRN